MQEESLMNHSQISCFSFLLLIAGEFTEQSTWRWMEDHLMEQQHIVAPHASVLK